jgi:GAF domain-containing protein/HAMP domain-containing protein
MLRLAMSGAPAPVLTDIVDDGPGGAPVIVIAVPVVGDYGEFLGLMAGMFRVGGEVANSFYGDIMKLRLGESGSAYLVDSQGRVIYHSDPAHVGDGFSWQPIVQRVLDGEVGAVRTRDLAGQEIVASYAPVPGTPWSLASEESWSDLINASRGYRRGLLLLLALGVAVPALVVAIGLGRITRPITDLTAAAQKVAAGEFEGTITAGTGDEIEELAEQFNRMSAQLQLSYANLEQTVANRTRELDAVNAIAAVVSQTLDLQEILNDALDKTLQVMDIEAGGIYLLDEAGGVMTMAAHRGFSPQFVAEVDKLKVGEGFSGRVAQSGEPLVVRDVSADPRLTRSVVREEGLRSLATVPLSSRGKVLGTLFAVTHGYRAFTDRDVQLLTSIGHQIGIAVENSRLFAQAEQRLQELEALYRADEEMHRHLHLDQVLHALVDVAVEILQADKSALFAWDKDQQRFVMRVARGFSAEALARLSFGPGDGGTWHVAATGEPVLVWDTVTSPFREEEREEVVETVLAEGIRSFMHLPIRTNDEVYVFNVSFGEPYAFGKSEQRLFAALAQRAALAVENAQRFITEQRRAEQFRVIGEVGRHTTSIRPVGELLDQLARLIQRAFGYYHVAIGLVEGDELALRVGAGRLWDDAEFRIVPSRLKVRDEGITGWVAGSGEPLLVPDVSQEPRYVWMEGSKTRSELAVPIQAKGEVIGVLDVQSDQLDAFDESDLLVLQSLAHQAAIALENTQLFKAEHRRAEQFRVIGEVGSRITSILAIDELLEEMARLIRDAFNYYGVGIGLVEGDEVVYRAGAGAFWDATQLHERLRLKVGEEGLTGWVAATGEPLLVPDVSQEPRFYYVPEVRDTRSELCVPLKVKSRVIGVLIAESDRLGGFDESDLLVFQSVANQAAIAIDNARLFRDTTRQVVELRALADASRIISSVLDQDQLLEALYEQITRIAPADFYLIALYDEASNVVSIEINEDAGVRYPQEEYALEQGLLKVIIHERRALRFDSLPEEKHTLEVEILPTGSPRLNQGWLGVPMLYGEKVVGALIVGSYERGAFDEGHQQILTSIANQAAVALDNARLYEQGQRLAVMEERQRLARELHDAVTQTLFSASLISEALPELWEADQEEGRQLLKELRQLSRGALAEMRTLLLELRPAALVETSLEDLLHQLGEAVTGRIGVAVDVSVEGPCRPPTEVHVALYRIAQEALNNVVKHAEASEVAVSLRCEPIAPRSSPGGGPAPPPSTPKGEGGRIELEVRDNGQGFDPSCIPPDRLGLGIIRERAQDIGAMLRIRSEPGAGTVIAVVWEVGG